MTERSYAHRTLAQKLGVEKAERVLILRAPSDYVTELGMEVPESTQPYDFIQIFATSADKLEFEFPTLKSQLNVDGMLWVSWPKKKKEIPSDLTENKIRNIGLENGLVDVKVVSVNDQWSGLKFVYRKKDRK